MSLLSILAPILLVALSFAPVWLLRAALTDTPPSVLANSAIGLGLRVAVLVPCFWLGAQGAFWPVVVGAAAFMAGVAVLAAFRRPILTFVDEALAAGSSATPAAFLGRALQRPAGAAIALLLLGLLGLEAKLTYEILADAVGGAGAAGITAALFAASLGVAWLASAAAGMQAMQLQLGLLYFGLFGAAVLLVYLKMAAVAAPSFQGTVGVAALAALSVALMSYRRNKYVETRPVRRSDVPPEALRPSELRLSRGLGIFVKVLNRLLTTLLVVAAVFAAMQLYFSGALPTAPASRSEALPVGLAVAIAVTSFLAPMVDPANWQRIAAARAQSAPGDREAARAIGRAVAIYAVETPLVCLFVTMLGAVAATSGWGTGAGLSDYVAYLVAQEHAVADATLWFILLAVLAAALSSMIGTLAALFGTVRADLFGRR